MPATVLLVRVDQDEGAGIAVLLIGVDDRRFVEDEPDFADGVHVEPLGGIPAAGLQLQIVVNARLGKLPTSIPGNSVP